MHRVDCQSCNGTGKTTYPEAPLLDGGTSPAIVGWCLACSGHGYFIRPEGERGLTHAGPKKEGEPE